MRGPALSFEVGHYHTIGWAERVIDDLRAHEPWLSFGAPVALADAVERETLREELGREHLMMVVTMMIAAHSSSRWCR